jgi:hypothetical protein
MRENLEIRLVMLTSLRKRILVIDAETDACAFRNPSSSDVELIHKFSISSLIEATFSARSLLVDTALPSLSVVDDRHVRDRAAFARSSRIGVG